MGQSGCGSEWVRVRVGVVQSGCGCGPGREAAPMACVYVGTFLAVCLHLIL